MQAKWRELFFYVEREVADLASLGLREKRCARFASLVSLSSPGEIYLFLRDLNAHGVHAGR